MKAPSMKFFALAAAMCAMAISPADAPAQYGYAGYGGYGGYGRSGVVGVAPTGVQGSAFIRSYGSPYGGYGYGGYGYGGYGYAGQRTILYRAPSSFDRSDDPWQPETQTDALKRSIQRFRDLREDSRTEETYYSNETYKRNNPFDPFYYERMMTP